MVLPMSPSDFVHKHSLKNNATSNIKTQQIFFSLNLLNDVKINSRDGLFTTDVGIVNIHPTK